MQQKSPRGVQQEDVAAAADELLNEGLRPTIERVRLKMGRGSPNTAGPMLETWFGSLGARLAGVSAENSGDQLPQAVLKAATLLWYRAERAAMTQADETIAAAHASLAEARTAHEADVASLATREEKVAHWEADLSQALELAKIQLAEQGERMSALSATIAQRDSDLEMSRRQAAASAMELAEERRLRQEDAANSARSAGGRTNAHPPMTSVSWRRSTGPGRRPSRQKPSSPPVRPSSTRSAPGCRAKKGVLQRPSALPSWNSPRSARRSILRKRAAPNCFSFSRLSVPPVKSCCIA
jgi:hypothetical protein